MDPPSSGGLPRTWMTRGGEETNNSCLNFHVKYRSDVSTDFKKGVIVAAQMTDVGYGRTCSRALFG
jgi:hypothetical protein